MTYKKPSVCLVTCYKYPDYVRIKTLEAGLIANDANLLIVRNQQRGVLRYAEVILKLIRIRFSANPDIYFVTFRGYEILPFVLLIGIGKKVIFDEFINLIEWTVYEHNKLKPGGLAAKLLATAYRFLLKSTTKIITDTDSHVKYSAGLMELPISKYQVIPVGTDEKIFINTERTRKANTKLQVLYYGSMLPLHGIKYIIQTAVNLKNQSSIEFFLVGGGAKIQRDIDIAVSNGANIKYKKWVPYEELPQLIANADICLGGPFGGTTQSKFVITGKTVQFLRMSRPVIIGKNKESHIFTDGKDALIVKQANVKELARAIEWAYNNKSKLQAIGQAGHRLYRLKLSNKVLAKQVKELLTRL